MAAIQSSEHHEVPVDTFIPFMRDVMRCENSLHELNLMWRLIEASAKMNCPEEAQALLPMMVAAREGLQRLEGDLVRSLVAQSLGEVMAELRTSAHQVIDIVVRNLYERTADVGFLATDQELCHYVAGLSDGSGVLERLREYRNKYTVYDEILLIDPQGAVLAQVDERSPVEGCDDPLIAAALQHDGYVETFRATGLRPGKAQALLYAHRMLHPQTQQPVGVLCLGFDFEGEMRGLFEAWSEGTARSIALLLDADQRVLASSDAHWIRVGERVPVNRTGAPVLHVHSGRTYLVQTVAATGYQGYPGPPGWAGQVMIPVEQAFVAKVRRAIDQLEPAVVQGLLAHARSFCPPLHDIVTAADTIRRVVWNGQVMTAGQRGSTPRLKAVLEQIGETGWRTNEVFAQSIRDLYDTVLSTSLRDSELLAQLLIDLLGRNLYERANDCRWWALTPQLRSLLTGEAMGCADASARTQACQILEHINQLYTVYARIVVYDRAGTIVAASRPLLPDGRSVIGMAVEADTLEAVCCLRDAQSYHATPWRSCTYGAGVLDDQGQSEPGYVYHAAIRTPDEAAHIVGGIGVVFNTAAELLALSFRLLGEVQADAQVAVQRRGMVVQSAAHGGSGREMATFFVGAALFAVDAEHVLEALPASAVAPVSAGRLPYCMGTLARRANGSVTGYVWVFDLAHLLTGQPSQVTAHSQVVVLQCAGRRIGVLVSELQGVNTFAPESIVPMPGLSELSGALVQELIRANGGTLLVQCLHPQALLDVLQAQPSC